jgi:hypothetical protein
MSISRRGFFRGLTGKNADPQRERQKRELEIEAYVRTNLLPYDFALTQEQTAEALSAAVAGVEIDSEGDLLTWERRNRIRTIVDEKVERWRDDYLKAEAIRHDAMRYVQEFLSFEATPENLQQLRQRFQLPDSGPLEEEVERQIRVWLADFPNQRLVNLDPAATRELVFSEIRSWC